MDESPEYVLPISFVNTVTYHIDAVMARDYAWFETLLQKQRGFVQQEKEVLLELMQRVLEVKNGSVCDDRGGIGAQVQCPYCVNGSEIGP